MTVANAQPAAMRLLEMAREIAHEADPIRRDVQRQEARFDRDEDKARQRLREARRAPEEPETLKTTRESVEAAQRAARRAQRVEKETRARVAEIEEQRPRGLWPWLTGKTAQHRQELEAAKQAEREAAADRRNADQRAVAMDTVGRSAERKWADRRGEIEREQKAEATAAEKELAWIGRARIALRNDPALARDEQALRDAVETMRREEFRRRLELVRGPAHDEPTYTPRGPGMGR